MVIVRVIRHPLSIGWISIYFKVIILTQKKKRCFKNLNKTVRLTGDSVIVPNFG
jgi:hypothetical protein